MKITSGRRFERVGVYPLLLMGAAAMLIFGSMAAWVKRGSAAIPGIAGDGIITIMCGILILGLVLLLTVGEKNRLRSLSLSSYGAGFVGLFVAVYYLVGIIRCDSGLEAATAGVGVYLTLAGGAMAVIGSLGGVVSASRLNLAHPGQLSRRDRNLVISLTLAVALMVVTVFMTIGR